MADPKTLSLMAAAAIALAGCAGTHVGDDWQCPAAQGSVCTSVGDADPAVPELTQPWDPVHRAEHSGRDSAAREPVCGHGCDPLGWLGALLEGIGGGDGVDGSEPPAVSGEAGDAHMAAMATPEPEPLPADLAESGGPAPAGNTDPITMASPDADPAVAARALQSGADAVSLAALEAPFGDGVRVPDEIGRVWIAPFVDAGGIYREASWVRVVIAPARWRLP